tara:strand:- start:11 stop:454 length:444 start_codon:yes stop_codon:yes gene_type:complete
MLSQLLLSLNSSRIIGAFLMFVMNIGSKYIAKDVPLAVDIIFDNFWARMFVVLCIGFISTRDIMVSLLITLLYILIFAYLLNDNSASCIMRDTIVEYKEKLKKFKKEMNPQQPSYDISSKDVINAREVIRRYELEKRANNDIGDIYL